MTRIQVIERNGKPAFYLVPAATWGRVREAIEDAEDAFFIVTSHVPVGMLTKE